MDKAKKVAFKPDDITKGLSLLRNKFTRTGYLIHMVERRYRPGSFLITHRTTGFSMILSEVAFHIYGQLGRYCFDKACNGYLTASLEIMFEQIDNIAKKNPPKDAIHEGAYKKAKEDFESLKSEFSD